MENRDNIIKVVAAYIKNDPQGAKVKEEITGIIKGLFAKDNITYTQETLIAFILGCEFIITDTRILNGIGDRKPTFLAILYSLINDFNGQA